METLDARIREDGDKRYLDLALPDSTESIPLTEDKPQEVKNVFNKLILLLKKTPLQFEFHQDGTDLYYEVGKEYTKQLNEEMTMIREELIDFELVESDPSAT